LSRTLMTVHAHPDDEASKGAGTVAKYNEMGVTCILVTATGGEEGDILNKKLDTPENREQLSKIRLEELKTSASVLGYSCVELLGYRDSGMPGSNANRYPDAFCNAPIEEPVNKLVGLIRKYRPQVIITYGADQRGYPHPDHIKTHEATLSAFLKADDPKVVTDGLEPFRPLKLYYTQWSRERIQKIHEKFLELGLESPFDERWFSRVDASDKEPITTSIDVSPYIGIKRKALRAHATQIDPDSKFWFGLSEEIEAEVYPYEDYHLAIDRTGGREYVEDDLFDRIN
jgi:mycothiol S-conjugate amidase